MKILKVPHDLNNFCKLFIKFILYNNQLHKLHTQFSRNLHPTTKGIFTSFQLTHTEESIHYLVNFHVEK